MTDFDHNDASLEAYEKRTGYQSGQPPEDDAYRRARLIIICFAVFVIAVCGYTGYKIITAPCKACQQQQEFTDYMQKQWERRHREQMKVYHQETREQTRLNGEINELLVEGKHPKVGPNPELHPTQP